MLLMKKDMGGAAHALALAGLVMGAGLKVRLHVLVPAVENAIAGNAFRPGDVLREPQGAHRRDRQHRRRRPADPRRCARPGARGSAELILDFATLTGAARVALGPTCRR